MRGLLAFFILLFLLHIEASGQRVCGSADYAKNQVLISSRPIQPVVSNAAARDTLPNETIIIPVVVHVLYNNPAQNISDAQIFSQLKSLNEDFRRLNQDASQTPDAFKQLAADTRISFCLAQLNPQNKPTSGIIRKYTHQSSFSMNDGMKFSSSGGDDAWDSNSYLNIWVCNLSGNTLGYSSFPDVPSQKDGVVIQYDVFGTTPNVRSIFNKGRTTTHEVGHWLGLKHIWGDNACGNDDIDDTPQQSGNNYNCPSFPRISTCSPNANGDMFMNYMDYTNDECMNMFTYGQAKKMRALFSLNGSKNTFLYSNKSDSNSVSGSALPNTSENNINNNKPLPNISIYPNPVGQFLNLMPTNGFVLNGKSATILNVSGSVLLQKKLSSNNDRLDLSGLSKGIYFLHISDGKEKTVLKLIKM
jgi:hypothetical protein